MERASTWCMVLTALAHKISLEFDANLVSVSSNSACKHLKRGKKYYTVVFKSAIRKRALFNSAKDSKKGSFKKKRKAFGGALRDIPQDGCEGE